MKEMGFNQTTSDPCMYVYTDQEPFVIGICVDDIKTHGSESRGQEEAACMRVFWPT